MNKDLTLEHAAHLMWQAQVKMRARFCPKVNLWKVNLYNDAVNVRGTGETLVEAFANAIDPLTRKR
jgi:hypothetical protein